MKSKFLLTMILSLFFVMGAGSLNAQTPTEVSTFAGLKTAIANGGSIKLTADISATEALLIGKDVTLDGNGKTITSSAKRIFRITASNIEVNFQTLNMVSTAAQNGATDDIRGISVDQNVESVHITLGNSSCNVSFTDPSSDDWCYGVNFCSGTNNCSLDIDGGSYSGANAINIWGTGHIIDINGATITST